SLGNADAAGNRHRSSDRRCVIPALSNAAETFGRLGGCHGPAWKRVMADQSTTLPSVATHGAAHLPEVEVDSYNVELKDDEGLLGDRANKGAFRAILERWRKPLRKAGDDPFGNEPT